MLRTLTLNTFLVVLSVMLMSCASTIELDAVTLSNNAKLTVVDSRSQEQRIYRRDGVLSPIQYFGDEDFSAPPLTKFSNLLRNSLPAGSYTLEVNQFRVIDVFPHRLHAGISGGLAGVLGPIGYAAAVDTSPIKGDNITCMIAGKSDSKSISSSSIHDYKISAFAGAVKNDSAFKTAVEACLKDLAQKVAMEMR